MKKPDPRIMFLMTACLSTMGVLIVETWLLAAVFAFSVLFTLFLGTELLVVVKKTKKLLGIIVVVALLESVFNSFGTIVLRIGTVNILTTGGLLRGANTLLRMGIVLVSASIFMLTTSRRLIQGLIQLKIPYEFAFMASVALRFLPVFSEEFQETVIAVQLRGVDIKRIPLRQKLKIYQYIIAPVVYGAVDKAQKLSYAMELRAFRAYPKRTSRFTLCLKSTDYVYMAVFPLLTAGVLVLYYLSY